MTKKIKLNIADERIVLRMNKGIAFERDFSAQYKTIPRARRQEWIRSVLRAGLSSVENPIDSGLATVQPKTNLLTTIAGSRGVVISTVSQDGPASK